MEYFINNLQIVAIPLVIGTFGYAVYKVITRDSSQSSIAESNNVLYETSSSIKEDVTQINSNITSLLQTIDKDIYIEESSPLASNLANFKTIQNAYFDNIHDNLNLLEDLALTTTHQPVTPWILVIGLTVYILITQFVRN